MKEYIPNQLLTRQALPNLKESLHYVHKPSVLGLIPQGYRRLAVQELLELRQEYDEKFVKPRLDKKGSEIAQALGIFIGENLKRLPYTLTKGQQKILQEILESIQKGEYVDSLVYGDVGSGKTIIALLLAFGLAKQGYSTILIAPTTILASQHVRTAQKLHSLFGLGHEVSLREVTARKGKAEGITDSTVYIGTQAIFHNKKLLDDKKVTFVCIDEQHRFGVEQRTLLKKEGRHVLTLSATPIPRTLALSFLGFSEAYFLEDKPLGRKQVISRLVPKDKEQTTYEWIAKHLTNGEQVYVVFPRIESEEESEKQSLLAMSASLITQYFSSFQSALLYGSLKEEEKNRIMSDFSSGKIRILFSTSVIEVGVDVPNATIIAIHGAELFGLAQLHQLRGRVGRSSQQGYCLLFSGSEASEANERLDYFSLHHDGITVSEYDLKHRGTGTLLGKQQSGLSELRMAQVTDLSMVKEAMTLYEELRSEKVAIPRYFRVKSTNE